jgi:hypothetical protein
MNVSMPVRRGAVLLLAAITVTACADVATSPVESRSPETASFARGGSPRGANHDPLAGGDEDDDPTLPDAPVVKGKRGDRKGIAVFVVEPRETRVYEIGPHSVYIPKGAICDPETSGYGPDLWDTPCTPLTKPITITARWAGKGGHGAVAFEPDLRFAPSINPSEWVWLTLHDKKLISDTRVYDILWYNAGDGKWVNETRADPTLRVYVNRDRNEVYRRVKHFSGYLVCANGMDGRFVGGDSGW